MRNALRVFSAVGFLAIGSTIPAHANPALPGLTNLNFLSYTGSAPKNTFTNVDPTGWTGGSGLIFIAAPGTSKTSATTACGTTYLDTWECPTNLFIPGGYNEVEADGNPNFESGFNYAVTGLTPGTTYTLSFYQAASQQRGFSGATTEQWIVSLGTSGFTTCPGCGPFDPLFGSNQSTYSNADPLASIAATPLMHTASHGLTDWNFVSVDLTAHATDELLSFLAWGNDGTTANLPPMVFLTGVNSPDGLTTPEPGSIVLAGGFLLGLGVTMRLRRKAKATV
jgi:hypothetical protein